MSAGPPEPAHLGVDGFAAACPVSRETLARLEAYVALLVQWNARINLVGPATLGDVWRRHILDSAQILDHLPDPAGTLVDLGSGAGLPGLILAILGAGPVHLIESDQRKAAFLREAARVTATPVTIHPARIEDMPELSADSVTSRALAPLSALLRHSVRFLRPGGACYFLKGSRIEEELADARPGWRFRSTLIPSRTDPRGVLVKLESITLDR